jgi:hypothetical protein
VTPGQLVRAVAIALDTPEETVTQHDRNLVVDGLRTKGGRGWSAPDVTPLDAARLLVATVASIRGKDSVAAVRKFEKAKFTPQKADEELHLHSRALPDPAVTALPPDHNFLRGLAALIADASAPIDDQGKYEQRFASLSVTCEIPLGRAAIGGSLVRAIYVPKDAPEPTAAYYGIRQRREVSGAAIVLLGQAFRDGGLPVKKTSVQRLWERLDQAHQKRRTELRRELMELRELEGGQVSIMDRLVILDRVSRRIEDAGREDEG